MGARAMCDFLFPGGDVTNCGDVPPSPSSMVLPPEAGGRNSREEAWIATGVSLSGMEPLPFPIRLWVTLEEQGAGGTVSNSVSGVGWKISCSAFSTIPRREM